MYSDTIKLCQDNKINARNTWTLNLIDYMPMLFKTGPQQPVGRTVSFQDEESPGGTPAADDMNFHRAGVTLDAGVKIYCSRVDSVHTNAFKVLGGLSRTGRSGEDGDAMGEGDEDGDDPNQKRKRKGKRTGRCTLENNMANITSQKLETDLAVDPLFQKMSAAFDEGGAKGMLLNNLPVGPKGQVLFDSGELADSLVLSTDSSEDGSMEASVYDVTGVLPNAPPSEFDIICGSFLRFFRAKKAMLDRTTASTTESSSSGNTSSAEAFVDNDHDLAVDFDYSSGDLQNAEAMGVFASNDAPADAAFQGMEDDDDVTFFGSGDVAGRQSLESNMSLALSARRASLDLVEAGVALSEDSEYAFFDTSKISGWAGPQHWRFRAAEASVPGYSDPADASKKKTKRPRGKNAMLLDFSAEAPKINFKKEFAQGKKENSYHLSNTVREAFSEKKVTLPEDLHFTVRSLTSLFLKPRTFVRPKYSKVEATKIESKEIVDQENGWYDFDNDCDNDNFCPDNSDAFANDEKIEPETSITTDIDLIPEPTRVEKIDINYAKVAKKVDVRQLKTGMWSRLCGETTAPGPQPKVSEQEEAEEDPASPGDADNTEAKSLALDIRTGKSQSLRDVVQELPSFVPESSLTDVSLPYVFICLLHLANEKTLKISQTDNGSLTDLVITSGLRETE